MIIYIKLINKIRKHKSRYSSEINNISRKVSERSKDDNIHILESINIHTIIDMHINPINGYSSEINNTSRKVSERSKDDNIQIY